MTKEIAAPAEKPGPTAASSMMKRGWSARDVIRRITGRKQAEEALEASRVLLDRTFASLNEAVFVVEPNTRTIIACNPAAERVFGYRDKEMMGRNTEFLHVDRGMYEDFGRKLFLALDTDGVFHTEHLVRRKDGGILSTEHTVTEIVDDSGQRTGLVSVVRDVTERKRTEEELAKHREHLAELVEERTAELQLEVTERKRAEEALRERTYDLGERVKELNCLYGIARLVEQPGVSLEEIVQGTVNLIPASWQYPEVTCARIILGGQEARTENFRETPWMQTSEITVRGERIGAMEVCYLEQRPESDEGPFQKDERSLINAIAQRLGEAVERKRAEEALERLSRQNKLILESAGEGIFGLDRNGNTTFANPAAARMIGRDVEELIGQSEHDIVHHSKPDGTPYPQEECPIYAAFKDGAVHHVTDEVFWRKDGTSFPVEYVSTPIREKGELIGAVVAFKDLSEQREMEEALRKAREELEARVEHQMLRRNPYGLTFRELTVLHLVAAGQSDKEIGTTLGISPLTAQKHIENLRIKMEAASRTEASVRAVREGLLD